MQLERLTVRGFRSLYDVEIHAKHFAVFVGANNAGKSNLRRGL